MYQIEKWLRENFGYVKKEINGSIILLFIVVVSFLAVYLFDYWQYATHVYATEKDVELLEQWHAELRWKEEATEEEALSRPLAHLKNLQKFDPNQVTEKQLIDMNLPRYLATNWAKYTQKGGRFSTSQDLLKLYGMDATLFEQLAPFVMIVDDVSLSKRSARSSEQPAPNELSSRPLIDINLATAEELQTVKGIGQAYSARIMKYRKLLGGFHSRSQLREVYGLKEEVVEAIWQKFDLDTANCCLRRSVNTVALDSLKKQPYMSYNQARALIAYRDQHGRFESWDDVAEIKIIPDSTIQKLKPYFEF